MNKTLAYYDGAAMSTAKIPTNIKESEITYSSIGLGKALICQVAIDRDCVRDEFTEGLISILKIRVRTLEKEGLNFGDYRIDIRAFDGDDQVIAERRIPAQDGEYEFQVPLDYLSSVSHEATLKVELRFVELYEFIIAPVYEYCGFLHLKKRLLKPEHPEIRSEQIDCKTIVINRHYLGGETQTW